MYQKFLAYRAENARKAPALLLRGFSRIFLCFHPKNRVIEGEYCIAIMVENGVEDKLTEVYRYTIEKSMTNQNIRIERDLMDPIS